MIVAKVQFTAGQDEISPRSIKGNRTIPPEKAGGGTNADSAGRQGKLDHGLGGEFKKVE